MPSPCTEHAHGASCSAREAGRQCTREGSARHTSGATHRRRVDLHVHDRCLPHAVREHRALVLGAPHLDVASGVQVPRARDVNLRLGCSHTATGMRLVSRESPYPVRSCSKQRTLVRQVVTRRRRADVDAGRVDAHQHLHSRLLASLGKPRGWCAGRVALPLAAAGREAEHLRDTSTRRMHATAIGQSVVGHTASYAWHCQAGSTHDTW